MIKKKKGMKLLSASCELAKKINSGLCVCVCVSHSIISNSLATPWTGAHQAPLSTGITRQEYWSEVSFLSPGDLPDPGIEPGSPASQADSLPSEPPEKLSALD